MHLFLFEEIVFCDLLQVENLCHKLEVIHVSESSPSVTLDESVKIVRPHIVCCIVSGLSFGQHTYKKFIQLQVILNIINPCLSDLNGQGGWVGKVDKSAVTGSLLSTIILVLAFKHFISSVALNIKCQITVYVVIFLPYYLSCHCVIKLSVDLYVLSFYCVYFLKCIKLISLSSAYQKETSQSRLL